jgi:hypothetical protein
MNARKRRLKGNVPYEPECSWKEEGGMSNGNGKARPGDDGPIPTG